MISQRRGPYLHEAFTGAAANPRAVVPITRFDADAEFLISEFVVAEPTCVKCQFVEGSSPHFGVAGALFVDTITRRSTQLR
jgi:hypothetical protein